MALDPTERSVFPPPGHRPGADVPIGEAVEHVRDAFRDVVEIRMEMMKREVRDTAQRSARAGAFLLTAGIFALFAWAALMATCFVLLDRVLPLSAAVGSIAGLNLVLALIALVLGRRSLETHEPE